MSNEIVQLVNGKLRPHVDSVYHRDLFRIANQMLTTILAIIRFHAPLYDVNGKMRCRICTMTQEYPCATVQYMLDDLDIALPDNED